MTIHDFHNRRVHSMTLDKNLDNIPTATIIIILFGREGLKSTVITLMWTCYNI